MANPKGDCRQAGHAETLEPVPPAKTRTLLDDPRLLLVPIFSSSVAGVVSKLLCYPLDTIKARLQATQAANFQAVSSMLVRTARKEGVAGLYRGLGATVVGGAPGMALYMTTYEACKALGASRGWDDTAPAVHLSAGMAAEAVSCVVFVPVDVIKERLQVQRGAGEVAAQEASPFLRGVKPYRNSWDALRVIGRTEGLAGLYKGYGVPPCCPSDPSPRALSCLFYEAFKKRLLIWRHGDPTTHGVTFGDSLVAAASTAGGLAGFLTSPLDLAKLRFQLQRGKRAAQAAQATPK